MEDKNKNKKNTLRYYLERGTCGGAEAIRAQKLPWAAPSATPLQLQQWLRDPSQHRDVIASATTIAGFEWPSILMITSTVYESQFHVRNIVMRSMRKLVWLKTSLIDQVYELNVSIIC